MGMISGHKLESSIHMGLCYSYGLTKILNVAEIEK
jgi:hypothetical protein